MPGPCLFFLSSERLAAYRWRAGRLASETVFPFNPAGRSQFAEYARRLAREKRPAYFLTDLVEEDFRFDTIPHVFGAERKRLLARKLEQFYRTTPLRHAAVLKREKEGRRDDRVLFSALTNPSLLLPWVEILLQKEVALQGVTSVALVSHYLVKALAFPECLLLTWERDAGLRQTYFKDGYLNFSRLTPVLEGDYFVPTAQTETARTYQYLHSLSLLPANRPLEVCIVCGARDRQELARELKGSAKLRYTFLDLQELGQRLGYKDKLPDSDATALLLHVLARFKPRNQYGSEDHTHYYALWEISRITKLASALAAFGCLTLAGMNFWQALGLSAQSRLADSQTQALVRQYQAIVRTFPQTLQSAEHMRDTVLALRKLSAFSPSPQAVLTPLGQTLAQFPHLRVNGLSWRVTSHPEAVQAEEGRSERAAGSPLPAARAVSDKPFLATPYRVVFLKGEIQPFDHDYREALKTINRFEAALTRAGMEVIPVALPLDLRPEANLAGDSARPDPSQRAEFSLRIVQEPR